MMIIDPVTLGDVSCTRASTATYYDRNGVLQTAPANTLRVTYDPSDLSKAPYALVEQATTNYLYYSEGFNFWDQYFVKPTLTTGFPSPDGGNNATQLATADSTGGAVGFSGLLGYFNTSVTGVFTASIWARCASGTLPVSMGIDDNNQANYILTTSWQRLVYTSSSSLSKNAGDRALQIFENTVSNVPWQLFGGQVEPGSSATSYIKTPGAATGFRAADVIALGAGLVYSNVAITETPYNSGSTYALNAVVYDPATYLTFQSLIASNTGRVLTDTGAWTPLKLVVNQRLMLDQYNNTQTSNPEEIIIVLSPRAIAQGVFLGNVDASEMRISSVDLTAGLVYQEVQSLLVSTSGGSFYNWCFKRWKKRSYAVSVQAPPYANCLVTIAIKKPGGVARCGMCVLGPLVDVGLAQYGLSREIKDYSTVNFNFDGTSNVVLRNFAKIMDVDLVIDNDQIDSVIEALEGYRQKPVAWIGTAIYGSACLFGTYTSFKNVIAYPTQSNMSLQIQGTI